MAPLRGGQKASRVSRREEFKVTPLSRSSSVAAARPLREPYMNHIVFWCFPIRKSGSTVPLFPGASFTCALAAWPPIPVLLLPSRSLWSGSVAHVLCPWWNKHRGFFYIYIYFFPLFPALSRIKCKAASQLCKVLWVIHLSLQADQGHNLTKLHKSR